MAFEQAQKNFAILLLQASRGVKCIAAWPLRNGVYSRRVSHTPANFWQNLQIFHPGGCGARSDLCNAIASKRITYFKAPLNSIFYVITP